VVGGISIVAIVDVKTDEVVVFVAEARKGSAVSASDTRQQELAATAATEMGAEGIPIIEECGPGVLIPGMSRWQAISATDDTRTITITSSATSLER
jgi:hypothetical protein